MAAKTSLITLLYTPGNQSDTKYHTKYHKQNLPHFLLFYYLCIIDTNNAFFPF
ncbi:MAG: hypothetical protein KBT09_08070 [Bacteroidales bacterium]|nr:hypothetical protein [Candidatus Sodaliphilus fimicaballi]